MAWESLTLDQVLGNIVTDINSKINEMQEKADQVLVLKAKVEDKFLELNQVLSELENLAQRLEASGFYFIKLSPKQGSWNERLVNAENAPPTDSEFFTAIFATIIVAPGLDTVESSFTSLSDALTKEIKIPAVSPVMPVSEDFSFPIAEVIEDSWKSLALKDIFPGMAKSLEKKLNAVRSDVKKIESILNQLTEKYTKLIDAIDEAQRFLDSLQNTGVYRILLEPGQGSWISRMTGEEGSPPSDPSYYSAGIAIVICVPTLEECQALFDNLLAGVGNA